MALPLQLVITLPATAPRAQGRNSRGAFGTMCSLRLGEDDRKTIEAAAALVGLGVTTFIRVACLHVSQAMLEHANADAAESSSRVPPR